MNTVYSAKYYDNELEKEIEFKYYKEISLSKKLDFVNNVLDVLFQNNYCYAVIRNELFDIMLVDSFTDVFLEEEDFTFTINEIDKFLSKTNVVDILKKEINPTLLKELSDTIDINIAYKTGVNLNSISTSFSSLLKTIEEKVSNFNVDELTNTLKEFANITDELSQEKIIELYTKSDKYKKNYKGTLNNKNKQIRELKKELNNK